MKIRRNPSEISSTEKQRCSICKLYKNKLLKLARLPFLILAISLVITIPLVAYSQSGDEFKVIKTPVGTIPVISNYVIFGISVLVVLLIMLSVKTILKRDPAKPSFLDIIREADWYPSLSRFQFLVWTCIILFAFFAVYLIRLSNGVLEPISAIPENLLILMGISIISPVAGTALSSLKYNSDSPSSKPIGDEMKKRGFYTMLEENGKPSLARAQMFSWTWIAVAIYLILFFSSVNNVTADYTSHKSDCDNSYNIIKNNSTASIEKKYKCMYDLNVPNVDVTFVVLMGLSQGAYLGGKFTSQQKPQVALVSVNSVQDDTAKIEILIIGTNFGQTGVIKMDDKIIDPPSGITWGDEKIKLTILKAQVPEEGKCKFIVISGGVPSNEYDNSEKKT